MNSARHVDHFYICFLGSPTFPFGSCKFRDKDYTVKTREILKKINHLFYMEQLGHVPISILSKYSTSSCKGISFLKTLWTILSTSLSWSILSRLLNNLWKNSLIYKKIKHYQNLGSHIPGTTVNSFANLHAQIHNGTC